jgi:hypothetical protein
VNGFLDDRLKTSGVGVNELLGHDGDVGGRR